MNVAAAIKRRFARKETKVIAGWVEAHTGRVEFDAVSGTRKPSPPLSTKVPPMPSVPGWKPCNVQARDFLLSVMNDAGAPIDTRMQAARDLLPYRAS